MTNAVRLIAGPPRFVAVVCFGDDTADLGVVFVEGDSLYVLWPDGAADMVFRDRRGWLWDEYGDEEYQPGRRADTPRWGYRCGTRLPMKSRRRVDAMSLLDTDDGKYHPSGARSKT